MGKGRGNEPAFAKFMNRKNNKANEKVEVSEINRFNDSAKGQSMKNSNAAHRTCQ